jgi:hypothetical protein
MKKTIRRHSLSTAAGHRALSLSHETIRTLRAADLTRAVSGCDTTSYTTDGTTSQHTQGASAINCASTKNCV